ncbi:MAG: lysophospholipid acyltransferase family protein [Rhodovarius sp.]|nr:lysophospholipid acyltransferase family protein [Rhodovarius sp.]
MARPAEPSPVGLWSEKAMRFFHVAFARSFAGSFRALRIPPWGMPEDHPGRALVVYANHPGWWDGVMFMLLLRRFHPGRPAFIPMDAAALRKYPFMRRLGVFPVEQESARGAVAFLRTAREVLQGDRHMLWMNAPGRFCDVRERPVPISPGMVRLPEIAPHALFIPLAFEYTYWTEKRGEALAAFGPAIEGAELAALPRPERAERLRAALTAVMDRLAADAMTRDPARFVTVVEGGAGVGGIYGFWQYLKALARREKHDPHHDPRAGRS